MSVGDCSWLQAIKLKFRPFLDQGVLSYSPHPPGSISNSRSNIEVLQCPIRWEINWSTYYLPKALMEIDPSINLVKKKTWNSYSVSAILAKIDGDPPKILRPTGVFFLYSAAADRVTSLCQCCLQRQAACQSLLPPCEEMTRTIATPAPFALGFRDSDSGPQPWSTQATQDSCDKLCFL